MTDHLQYQILENHIHEFVFLTNKRQAADAFYEKIGEVFDNAPENELVYYIVDWSESGVPSMNYMFEKAQEWGRKHPDVAPGRGIVLFSQRGFASIGNAMTSLLMQMWRGKINLRFEHIDKREAGIKWLLAEDVSSSRSG